MEGDGCGLDRDASGSLGGKEVGHGGAVVDVWWAGQRRLISLVNKVAFLNGA